MSEKLFEGNLPKPLSNEEITELFIKYQNGSKVLYCDGYPPQLWDPPPSKCSALSG